MIYIRWNSEINDKSWLKSILYKQMVLYKFAKTDIA